MSRMFDSYYKFTVGEGYFDKVTDMTPARLNREHKHSDVESGLDNYTHNWECVDESYERRRGSDKLYLVNDKDYVWCSRTGMEKAGNSIRFSKSSSEELRYTVWSSVFENVLERKFGSIKDGICKESIIDNGGSISPKTFVLVKKLSQEELDSYFDDMADLVIELIEKYHNTTSTTDIENLTAWFEDQTTILYRDYTDFEPSILSQVLNNIEGRNGWVVPTDEIDGAKRVSVHIHENYTPNMEDGDVMDIYTIEINEGTPNEANLVYEDDTGETIMDERTYQTRDELRNTLEEWFEFTPENYNAK